MTGDDPAGKALRFPLVGGAGIFAACQDGKRQGWGNADQSVTVLSHGLDGVIAGEEI